MTSISMKTTSYLEHAVKNHGKILGGNFALATTCTTSKFHGLSGCSFSYAIYFTPIHASKKVTLIYVTRSLSYSTLGWWRRKDLGGDGSSSPAMSGNSSTIFHLRPNWDCASVCNTPLRANRQTHNSNILTSTSLQCNTIKRNEFLLCQIMCRGDVG